MKILKFINLLILNVWFYFWAPFVLSVSLLLFVSFVTIVRIFRPGKVMYFFRRSINLYGKAVTLTAWPWIRTELHNLPSLGKVPYIFVENHSSSFDPFVQGLLPYEIVQSAKGWALRFPVLGRFARWAGYLDVDTLNGEQLIEKAEELLMAKVSIVFFPEGTRTPDNLIGPFHSAAFRVAIDTSTPIVPTVITGISDKPSKGSFIMHPGKITIVCMDILNPEDFKNKTPFTLKKYVREKMISEIQEKEKQ